MALSVAKEKLRQQAVTRLTETIASAQEAIRLLGEIATDPKDSEKIGRFYVMDVKRMKLTTLLFNAKRALGKARKYVEEMYKKKGTEK